MVTKFAPAQSAGAALHVAQSGPAGGQHVLLLHGLFGMGSNLGSLARALEPQFRVHQIDLPNHGRSPWCDEMTLGSLAGAVLDYAAAAGAETFALVGHSLGGKVAMEVALREPGQVAAVVVADIAPVAYPGSHDAVFAAIRAVQGAQPESRRAAGDIMRAAMRADGEAEADGSSQGVGEGVVAFLSLSLARDEKGRYRWRFNADALADNYAELRRAVEPRAGYAGPALFIYGSESNYVGERGRAAAVELFSAAQFRCLEGAGHWLHAEQPEQFNGAVTDFLADALAQRAVAP